MSKERIKLENVSIDELVDELEKYFDESDANKIIDYLDEKEFNNTDEYFMVHEEENLKMQPGKLGYVFSDTKYSINIKMATIAAIAATLDCTVTGGIITAVLAGAGKIDQFVTIIGEKNGSKCIVREALKSEKRIFDINSIPGNEKNECINNDLLCKYKKGDCCTISKGDIKEIVKDLANKNVFDNYNDSYKLSF